jgi:phosphate transport system protein
MMVERHFDDELKELKTDLLKMATMTENAIARSVEALEKRDTDLAGKVVEEDSIIDEKELEIEEKAIDLLALRQPMAKDLRFITTGMKVNAELERIADLAVNICQRLFSIADQPHLKPLVDIPQLARVARKMVRQTIDAFVNRDEELAKQVILMDPEADRIRNSVQKELMQDYMLKDPSSATRAVPLLLVARHLERICDHATYIAEDVIYMINAKVVKHHREELHEEE